MHCDSCRCKLVYFRCQVIIRQKKYGLFDLLVSVALQEAPDLATALKCLLPTLGGAHRSVHPPFVFSFSFFFSRDGVGGGSFSSTGRYLHVG